MLRYLQIQLCVSTAQHTAIKLAYRTLGVSPYQSCMYIWTSSGSLSPVSDFSQHFAALHGATLGFETNLLRSAPLCRAVADHLKHPRRHGATQFRRPIGLAHHHQQPSNYMAIQEKFEVEVGWLQLAPEVVSSFTCWERIRFFLCRTEVIWIFIYRSCHV